MSCTQSWKDLLGRHKGVHSSLSLSLAAKPSPLLGGVDSITH